MLIIIKQKCRKLLRFAGIIANECEQTIERQRKHQLLRQFSQKKMKEKKLQPQKNTFERMNAAKYSERKRKTAIQNRRDNTQDIQLVHCFYI